MASIPEYKSDGTPAAHRSRRNRARTLPQRKSIAAEAFGTLRTGVRFNMTGRHNHIIGITSANSGEGKSTVTANLAASLASDGFRTAVVSLDFRRPTIDEFFNINGNTAGLTSVVLGDSDLEEVVIPYSLDTQHIVYVLPSGPAPPNPTELLSSAEVKEIIERLGDAADFVLIDTPPLVPISDALIIAQYVDAMLIVTAQGLTNLHQLRRAVEQLRDVDADIMGAVLNRTIMSRHERTYRDYPADDSTAMDRRGPNSTQPRRRRYIYAIRHPYIPKH